MRVEVGGRGSGKTAAMVRWLRRHENGVMYTFSEQEAERVRKWCDPDGTRGLAARIVSTTATRGQGFYWPEVVIDNVDIVLRQMFGDVKVVTMTGDEDE